MSLIGFWNRLFKRDEREGRIFSDSVNAENLTSAGTIDIKEGAIATGSIYMSAVTVKDGLFVLVTNPRTHRLRSEIDRLRRNKKKVSHLVAELAELEDRK